MQEVLAFHSVGGGVKGVGWDIKEPFCAKEKFE